MAVSFRESVFLRQLRGGNHAFAQWDIIVYTCWAFRYKNKYIYICICIYYIKLHIQVYQVYIILNVYNSTNTR